MKDIHVILLSTDLKEIEYYINYYTMIKDMLEKRNKDTSGIQIEIELLLERKEELSQNRNM